MFFWTGRANQNLLGQLTFIWNSSNTISENNLINMIQCLLKDIIIHITKKKVLYILYYYRIVLMNNIKKTDQAKNVYTVTDMLNSSQ